MKNGKWMPLDLKDIRKSMSVIHGKPGFTPSGYEPSRIKNAVFDTHGHISIELDNCITIRIVDLVRDADGQRKQLWHSVPLTIEEKYERLTAAAEKCIKDIRLEDCDCFLELEKLVEEYKE